MLSGETEELAFFRAHRIVETFAGVNNSQNYGMANTCTVTARKGPMETTTALLVPDLHPSSVPIENYKMKGLTSCFHSGTYSS